MDEETVKQEENSFSTIWCHENKTYMQKEKVGPLLISYKNINLKWIKDLNITDKNHKTS